jgi:hypothetical protein
MNSSKTKDRKPYHSSASTAKHNHLAPQVQTARAEQPTTIQAQISHSNACRPTHSDQSQAGSISPVERCIYQHHILAPIQEILQPSHIRMKRGGAECGDDVRLHASTPAQTYRPQHAVTIQVVGLCSGMLEKTSDLLPW